MNARLNQDTFYVDGAPIPASYFIGLDTAQYQALWGDQGGTWLPTSPIQIGGAGVQVAFATFVFSGSLAANTPLGSGHRFVHGANDFFTYVSASSRAVVQCFGQASVDRSFGISNDNGNGNIYVNVPRFFYENTKDGRKNYQSNGEYATYGGGGRLMMELDPHHGATLASVTVTFTVGQSHSSVPASLPQFRVLRLDLNGNAFPCLTNTAASGWQGNGFVAFNPTPATGALWYNSGSAQQFTYTCDAGIVVDTTQFRYVLEIIDENGSGALSGNEYISTSTSYTSIADMRFQ